MREVVPPTHSWLHPAHKLQSLQKGQPLKQKNLKAPPYSDGM